MKSLEIQQDPRWLVARFPQPCRALSWAVVGGGLMTTRAVAWWFVTGPELAPPVDPVALLKQKLMEKDLAGSVAMMTSRRLDRFIDLAECRDGIEARVVATVGLSNGVAVGDPATYHDPNSKSEPKKPGTINILCHLSTSLSDLALVEAVSLVAEARTASLLSEPMPSPLSGQPITGTGTDCVVVTCPTNGAASPYAGKHGVIGSLIGSTVRRALDRGRLHWQRDRDRGLLQMTGSKAP